MPTRLVILRVSSGNSSARHSCREFPVRVLREDVLRLSFRTGKGHARCFPPYKERLATCPVRGRPRSRRLDRGLGRRFLLLGPHPQLLGGVALAAPFVYPER